MDHIHTYRRFTLCQHAHNAAFLHPLGRSRSRTNRYSRLATESLTVSACVSSCVCVARCQIAHAQPHLDRLLQRHHHAVRDHLARPQHIINVRSAGTRSLARNPSSHLMCACCTLPGHLHALQWLLWHCQSRLRLLLRLVCGTVAVQRSAVRAVICSPPPPAMPAPVPASPRSNASTYARRRCRYAPAQVPAHHTPHTHPTPQRTSDSPPKAQPRAGREKSAQQPPKKPPAGTRTFPTSPATTSEQVSEAYPQTHLLH